MASENQELEIYGKEEDVIQENVGFEVERPIMDLNLPFLEVDKLLEVQKEVDDIVNEDLEEFRVKHGVITQMEYDKRAPRDL